MKHIDARVWTALVAIGVAVLTLPDRAMAQGAAGTEILTNESVVQMVVGKVPKDVMLTKIRSTSTAFDITANGLVSLYQRKVATDLLKAMMVAAGSNANKETLDNPAVLYMVSNGLPRDIIIAKIQSAKPGYDLTTAGLVSLNLNKVPPTVLKAMMASNSTGPAATGGATPSAAAPQSTAAPGTAAPGPATPSPAAVSPPTNTGQTTAARGTAKDNTAKDKKAPADKKAAPADKKKTEEKK